MGRADQSLQPFNLDTGVKELVTLNWLTNRDKHKVPLPCYTAMETPIGTFYSDHHVRKIEGRMSRDGRSKLDMEFFNPGGHAARKIWGFDPKVPPDTHGAPGRSLGITAFLPSKFGASPTQSSGSSTGSSQLSVQPPPPTSPRSEASQSVGATGDLDPTPP